ncbi:uncharacterized protein LOC116302406 [Actinia tenebrosa]|uniref:Uncharacterized protein LOC116302406 n=1 Tax=Actinia tenebrosa TaxID=6105 RepID=A0A6P8ILL7_ACTTE|nr:uncharacterized protein LOC116302406 [Actinia tenebrosa]
MESSNIGFVFFLAFNVVIPRAFCLECYSCKSHVSWEDCEENKAIVVCSDPSLDTCVKAHRAFVQLNGQATQRFQKYCFNYGDCNKKSCMDTNEVKKGSWCEIECCNTTLCNTGVTPLARKRNGSGSHMAFASANQVVIMMLIALVFVF